MSEPPPDDQPPEETLDDLYDHAPCGYVTLDSRLRVVRINATLLSWLGVGKADVVGRKIQDVLTPAGRIFFETHVSPLLHREGVVRQVAIDLRCAEGRRLPVLTEWRRVDVEGRPVGTRIMLVDATDRRSYERDLVAARERAEESTRALKISEARLRDLNETLEARVAERTAALNQAHEQLRHAQKLEAMGTLTGGVAHDFNNLLTPIIGGLDMLERRGIGDDRAKRTIAGALVSAERAKTLVQRLLAFARRQPLKPVAVDVVALVQGMADLIETTAGPQIEVRLDMDETTPRALADANQLEMALLNLAVNARDAMPGGGTLTLGVTFEANARGEAGAPRVRFSVADTGTGMDEETLARAIEPFFSTKGVGKGTGLGLSMVHGLAAQLGGHMGIESQPGSGTCIDLWLPLAPQEPCTAPVSNAQTPERREIGMVLLVDDEDLIRTTTAEMLIEMGYRVIEANCGAAALRLVDEGLTPDLLMTDHLMPGMTGTELARALRARQPMPVLIISGYADSDSIDPDLARLTKPFRQGDLTQALARIGIGP